METDTKRVALAAPIGNVATDQYPSRGWKLHIGKGHSFPDSLVATDQYPSRGWKPTGGSGSDAGASGCNLSIPLTGMETRSIENGNGRSCCCNRSIPLTGMETSLEQVAVAETF